MSADNLALLRVLRLRGDGGGRLQAARIALPARQLIAARLRLERERRKANATDVADWIGVDHQTYLAYEAGMREVGAGVLAVLAQITFDVQYIVTGYRSDRVEEIAAETIAVCPGIDSNSGATSQSGRPSGRDMADLPVITGQEAANGSTGIPTPQQAALRPSRPQKADASQQPKRADRLQRGPADARGNK